MALTGTREELLAGIDDQRTNIGLLYLKSISPRLLRNYGPGHNERINISSGEIFALHQVYETKPTEEAKYEAHQKYIDIHFIISGEEMARVAKIEGQEPYYERNDVAFYAPGEGDEFILRAGRAAIFYPDDIHSTGLDPGGEGVLVRKIVVKVRIDSSWAEETGVPRLEVNAKSPDVTSKNFQVPRGASAPEEKQSRKWLFLDRILGLKAWMVCAAVFATQVPILIWAGSGRGEFWAVAVMAFMMPVFLGSLNLWLWALGTRFHGWLPKKLRDKTGFFRTCIIYSETYTIFWVAALWVAGNLMGLPMHHGLGYFFYALLIPFILLSAVFMLYANYYVATRLIMAETMKRALFAEWAGPFLMICLYPVGIWFIQPRVNRLYEKHAGLLVG
ncbi:DUF386 domain-containing protein [bacterium]|nr:MAG: DUF386 domain-containing protein [bacterium]